MNDEYINKYLKLDEIIFYLERKANQLMRWVYHRSLATRIVYDGLTIHTEAPKIELLVYDHEQAINSIQSKLNRWKVRRKYFNDYLAKLAECDRQSVLDGNYSQGFIDEIKEIETAIAFLFGYEPPEEEIYLTDNIFEDLDLLVGALG
ncbi:MAG: hypothetical protein ACK5MW_04885 [Enterococcus sp.]